MKPVRSEELRIELVLNKKLADKYKKEIASLIKLSSPIEDVDTLTVNYTFSIDYFGDIVNNFKRVRKLLADPSVVRKVSLDELRHGESLIVELLDEIRKVQAAL